MTERWGVLGTKADGHTRWATAGNLVWTSDQAGATREAETLNRYANTPGTKRYDNDLVGWVWQAQRTSGVIRPPTLRAEQERTKAMKRRVIDYLCTDPGCKLASAWHQFDASTFALEEPGEYTVTLRVREVVTKQKTTR